MIIFTGEKGVLFKKGFASGFKLIDFSGADLKEGNFIKEPSVLSLAPVCILECDLLLDEIALRFKYFYGRSAVRGSFSGGVSVI